MSEFEPNESQLTATEVLQSGAEVLDHFGIGIKPEVDSHHFVDAISQLDPRYQGGRELVRWQLEADQTEWPAYTKNIII